MIDETQRLKKHPAFQKPQKDPFFAITVPALNTFVAARKGHSFIGYFILSLIFFPLALIMAYVVKDRRGLAVRSA